MCKNIVIPRTARDGVVAKATDDLVIPLTTIKNVITVVAVKMIIAGLPVERINVLTADNFVVATTAINSVRPIKSRNDLRCRGEGLSVIAAC